MQKNERIPLARFMVDEFPFGRIEDSGRENRWKDIVRQRALAGWPEGVADSKNEQAKETGTDTEAPKSTPEEGLRGHGSINYQVTSTFLEPGVTWPMIFPAVSSITSAV